MRLRTYMVLQYVSSIFISVLLILLFALVGYEAWRSFTGKAWQHVPQNSAQSPPGAAGSSLPVAGSNDQSRISALTAEQRLELEQVVQEAKTALLADIHENDANERSILDRLVTLVGAFSALLALSAYFTLKYARDDAKAQLERSERNLQLFQDNTKSDLKMVQDAAQKDVRAIQENAQRDLQAFREQTTSEMDSFRKQIWSELPEMRNLRTRLRALLLDLERTLPVQGDWNSVQSYEKLDVAQIQKILISETTVNGLQVFISQESSANNETLANLYRAIARFYSARFRKQRLPDDAERADIYLRKAIEIDPNNAGAYAQRGAFYLVRHRLLLQSDATHDPMRSEKLISLLAESEEFLREALVKDEEELTARYNLAMVVARRGSYDEAIEILSKMAGERDSLSYEQTKKYLPSIYINWACYLAKSADVVGGSEGEKEQLRERAIQVLREGDEFFEKNHNRHALKSFKESIERERKASGDFKNFSIGQQQVLSEILTLRQQDA